MKKTTIPTTSAFPNQDRLEILKSTFPEAFTEGKIDLEKLKATLGEDLASGKERYNFTWAGKRDAIGILQIPTRATLVPAPEESINFDTTQNIFIEGDNLEVLKLLYKSYFGRVKLIYIDPPYNTGNDFIYPDNYTDPIETYLQISGQKDAEGNLLTSNPETSGRYHSAWLSMMYPRLFLARQLLRDDGVIFISIDDNEVANLRKICDEIFGEENFLAQIIVQSNKRGQTYKQISKTHEYLLVYTKKADTEIKELEKQGDTDDLNFEDNIGKFSIRELRNRNPKFGKFNRPNLFFPIYVNPKQSDSDGFYPISIIEDETYIKPVYPLNSERGESCWRWSKKLISQNIGDSTLISNVVAIKKRNGDFGIFEKYRKSTYKAKSIWTETEIITEKGTIELGDLELSEYFYFPKPVFLIKKILMLSTEENDLVLDFFSGSSTTAHAVFEINREDHGNRNFILVQIPEPTGKQPFPTIAEVGKERIRRAISRIQDNNQFSQPELPINIREIPKDLGFRVYKLKESNFKPWVGVQEKDPEIYANQMQAFNDALVEGWAVDAVLTELAIKHGLSLTYQVEKIAILGGTVYILTDPEKEQSLFVCLDSHIELAAFNELKLDKETIFICLDSALDDETAANLALVCRLETI